MSIVLPVGIDLLDWAAQLQIDFPQDTVPVLFDRHAWRQWGNSLLASKTFSQSNCPFTDSFPDWQSWAVAFVRSLNR